jgi:hypothetical protein
MNSKYKKQVTDSISSESASDSGSEVDSNSGSEESK